ncbi:hypothetical protein M9Y10_003518 [Tritrichomonas musculus]|uniref:DUF3447 domain-containing protein n=1 Tax=Tritrichomonas musculus TaxID=1915356 RepID=A0ABR2JQ48_9EUKA
MITARSFNQTLYNQLKFIVTIQKDLSKLSSVNLKEIATKFLYQKEISNSESGISILAQCFKDEADFHPKNIEILADLFIFLQELASSTNYFHLLKDYTVSCIHTRDKIRPSFLFFLRTLLNRKAITIDLIIREILLMAPQFNDQVKITTTENQSGSIQDENESKEDNIFNIESKLQIENENVSGKLEEIPIGRFIHKKSSVINWFYPEILAYNSKIAQEFRSTRKYEIAPEFNSNNFNSLLPIMNGGYSDEKLAQVIREDDIDSFIKIVSQNGQSFDFNQTIKSTRYERCILLKTNPTLIQYASFFGSTKIFKFLFLNKADIQKADGMYNIVHFAVVGGCTEIIHILAHENEVDFVSAIPIAIQFFQNDILQWLIENYPPKSEEDFESMNYYMSNLNFVPLHRRYATYDIYRRIDDTEDNYYRKSSFLGKRDPIQKVRVRKSYPSQISSDYSDSDVIVDENKEEEEEDKKDLNDNFFNFFDFDILFESIVNSENYLSLFLLFDQGMSINACNKKSRKTILHYAIQKGKSFLVDLLLSNDLIDVSLNDENDQSPIVYSVKYTREKIFFKMMKMQKVLDILTDHDYIQMAFYSKFLELKSISEFLIDNWSIDLKYLMDTNDIKNFCDAVTYLPLNFFRNQIEEFLIESFKSRHFDYFCILLSRLLKEKDLQINAIFYFFPKSQNKGKSKEKDFAGLFQLFTYYSNTFSKKPLINYYKLYVKNSDGSRLPYSINYENMDQFHKEEYFFVSHEKNCLSVYLARDPNEVQNSKVAIQFLNENKTEKKIKKKKTNNNPTIVIDDNYDTDY